MECGSDLVYFEPNIKDYQSINEKRFVSVAKIEMLQHWVQVMEAILNFFYFYKFTFICKSWTLYHLTDLFWCGILKARLSLLNPCFHDIKAYQEIQY